MAFCGNCGGQVKEGAKFCGNCGNPLTRNLTLNPNAGNYVVPSIGPFPKDNKYLNIMSKFLFGILAFFLTIFGYILWFALKKHHPEQAKYCLIGSTIGSTIGSFLVIFSIALAFLIPDNSTVITDEINITKTDESEIVKYTENTENISDNTKVSIKSYLPLVWLLNTSFQIYAEKDDQESGLAVVIIICIIIYVISVLFSKKSSCIIVYGWKDFFLLVSPFLIIIFIILYNLFYGNDHGIIIEADNIVANILFLIPIILSFYISVVSNLRHSEMPLSVIFAVISIIGKLVIMIVMAVIIILFIGILGSYQEKKGEKDGRYKTGYRPGKNNFWFVAIFITILGFLATVFIKSIVKHPIDEMD